MKSKHKDPEKIYKELLARYQQEGYTIKQAKKFATQDTEEILMDRFRPHRGSVFNKEDK
tara:strand:+ start:1411 stop:1587 length:177 start_codon:yes stop_codon:yes gene_type:complete